MIVECPNCSARLKVNAETHIGRKARCPSCRESFVVRAPATKGAEDRPQASDDDFLNELDSAVSDASRRQSIPRPREIRRPPAVAPASDRQPSRRRSSARSFTKYESASTLVRVVTGLMIAHLVITAVAIGSDLMEFSMLRRAQAGMPVTEDETNLSDLRQAGVAVFQTLLLIPLAIVFLIWIHRANRNAESLVGESLTITPGWAVGWFFVPIMHLFKPVQAMKEVWQASVPREKAWRNAPVSPIVGWWWGLWILNNIAGQAIMRLSLRAETLHELTNLSIANVACNAIEFPLAILALMLVHGIHKMQEEKSHGRSNSSTGDCPECGEKLPSFKSVCPVCGHRVQARSSSRS